MHFANGNICRQTTATFKTATTRTATIGAVSTKTVAAALLLAFIVIVYGAHPVAAQESVAAQENVQAEEYKLPLDLQDESTVTADTKAGSLPPLQIKNTEGDFMITQLDDKSGLRILPDKASAAPGQSIELAWSIPLTSTSPKLEPGSSLLFTVLARTYSPPDGVKLVIQESNGEQIGSSSVTVQGAQWTAYDVSRKLDEGASEVSVGFEWKPSDDNAWVEFKDLTLAFFAPSNSSVELSPTDTPKTPTADAATEVPATQQVSAPLIVVTSTPTPPNVFAAATQVAAAQTLQAAEGTSTPTPANMVTATPTREPVIVTNTPTPGNDSTATYVSIVSTAIAATTGTATPMQEGALLFTATPTPDKSVAAAALPASTKAPTAKPAAKPTNTPRPTATPTPVFVPVDQLIFPTPTPTHPFPASLEGKILFLSPYLARNVRTPQAYAINPDGTGLSLLSSREFYDRAKELDAYSADKRFYFYNQREPLGANNAQIQVYYNDSEYGSTGHQLTYFGDGIAWGRQCPRSIRVSSHFISNETENDEIWVVRRDEWPATNITHNDWEWDRSPSFSPDGRRIAFESNRDGGTRQVWVMNADGSDAYQVTNFPFEAWEPVWVKYTD